LLLFADGRGTAADKPQTRSPVIPCFGGHLNLAAKFIDGLAILKAVEE
jgi:hypothetical protein